MLSKFKNETFTKMEKGKQVKVPFKQKDNYVEKKWMGYENVYELPFKFLYMNVICKRSNLKVTGINSGMIKYAQNFTGQNIIAADAVSKKSIDFFENTIPKMSKSADDFTKSENRLKFSDRNFYCGKIELK